MAQLKNQLESLSKGLKDKKEKVEKRDQNEDFEKNKRKENNENKCTKKYFFLKWAFIILLASAMTYFDEQFFILLLKLFLDIDYFENWNPAPRWLLGMYC